MKKVLALVLAVMMLATVAVAAEDLNKGATPKYRASVTPGSSIKIDQKSGVTGINKNAPGTLIQVLNPKTDDVINMDMTKDSNAWNDDFDGRDPVEPEEDENGTASQALNYNTGAYSLTDILFRAVTNENYAVTSVKSRIGRSLVKGVTINDKEERVEVKLVDDLNNTTAKDFEVTFTLKGKGKMTLKTNAEADLYNYYTGLSDLDTNGNMVNGNGAKSKGDRVTLPNVKFNVMGTVGYGKVEIFLGTDTDEELEDIDRVQEVNLDDDVVKFSNGKSIGDWKRSAGYPNAGAYVADAILTQHYGDALTMEARVYAGDTLYFGVDNDPDKDIVARLADSDADMDFYFFNDDTKFTTFNSNVKLYFNDAEETDFVYSVNKDNKLVPVGSYSEDDGCWVVKTRTLGKYVISDVELKEFEAAAGTTDGNPDTGANDVVGIAAALAAVALVSAAAVSLKK